jgi:protoheme IX farnesyltransferase
MSAYLNLTKFGICLFVVISGLAGFAVGFPLGQSLDPLLPLMLAFGLYCVCSGSFAMNQAQEWVADSLMGRTQSRPVPAGKIGSNQAFAIGIVLVVLGCLVLSVISSMSALLAFMTVVLYNGLYTLHWKKNWSFGAVPGAIPGAFPCLIGYAASGKSIFTPAAFYLFLVMFLWQMPHFWAIAVRYKDDYSKGGFPVLPVAIGVERTLYHVGLYLFVYVGVAMASPWFTDTNILYLLMVVPVCGLLLFYFFRYFHSQDQKHWLPFFMWVNFSLLIFISAPVFDRWIPYLLFL